MNNEQKLREALEVAKNALILGCPRSSQPKAWAVHHEAIDVVDAALSAAAPSADAKGGAA